jgi:hypothetical protein
MLTIAKLFGKSPFAPLQTHMDKVSSCVEELPALFQALVSQDMQAVQKIGTRISELEHEADLTKNDIRNHLPKGLFLQVNRSCLLDILSLQDAIADKAEEIAIHSGMRPLSFDGMREDFLSLSGKSIEAFWLGRKIIQELEELLESSFGGIEAQKAKGMVEQIAFCEHETVVFRNHLKKRLYVEGDKMAYPSFHLCLTLIEEIAMLACLSEKLANRIRMLLELK